jgi:hypothetical protein
LIAALLIALYLMTTLTAAIRREEAFLHRSFRAEYDRYRGKESRNSGGTADANGRSPQQVAARRFTWQQAIANREHRAVAGLIAVVLVLLLKATYNSTFGGAAGRP